MRKPGAVMRGRLSGALGSGLLLWTFGAVAATPLNTLTDVRVKGTPGGAQVVVSGTRAPTFTVFRLNDPDRLVIDLSSADASHIQGTHDGAGPVSGVVASQFADDHASVGRVLVALSHASQYDVRADGNRVLVTVQGSDPVQEEVQKPPPPPASSPPPAPGPAPAAERKPQTALAQAGAPGSTEEPNVVRTEGDERPVEHSAHRLTGVQLRHDALLLHADGQIAKYRVLELSDPPRLALDVYGVHLASRLPRHHPAPWTGLRAGAHPDKVRFVVDVAAAAPASHVHWTATGLEWRLGPAAQEQPPQAVASAAPEASAAPGEESEAVIDGQKVALTAEAAPLAPPPAPALAAAASQAQLRDLQFFDSRQGGRVELKLTGHPAYHVERPDERSAVLVLERTRLPRRLERSLDTSGLGSPVKMVSSFSVAGAQDRVRVVVAADGKLDQRVEPSPEGLRWHLDVAGVRTESASLDEKTAGFASEATSYAEEGAPHRAAYVGKKVSFEFKDIDIHNLLRLIGEISKKSIVVADDVAGKVTIRLRNVPWDQALEIILRSKGLGKEVIGNIIRVAPLSTLEHEAQERVARKAAELKQEPLMVQLIPVNYAKADDLSVRVKDVLSDRGTVTVDTRTNVLIVRDVTSGVGKARSLVQALDTQTPQVLIESRIVEANTTFSRQLGVQWGGLGQAAQGTGNPTGLIFPANARVGGAVDPGSAPTSGLPSTPNFAVNLPAAVGAGSGGALGFVFGSAGGALGLNLRLSALENQGAVKTISAPKVTTLDNATARISQGVSIPYSSVSASGVNTIFMEARLSLEVNPHITQDGSILMSIHAENNQPDPSSTGANGQPAIQRKEANTQVLVKDGDTTVIGGIYVRRGATSTAMVPFLGHIPVLGFFFRTDSQSENRQELLIFITPRIINRQTIAQGNL